MSDFSFPVLSTSVIIGALSDIGIAAVTPEHISNPTSNSVCMLYSHLLDHFCLLGDLEDAGGEQLGFAALELLDNPDHHTPSIRILKLNRSMRRFLDMIHFNGFNIRDLLRPQPRRTTIILSALINFSFHRDEKLDKLQPIVEQSSSHRGLVADLDANIAELNKESADHEIAREMEGPIIQELDAEVKQLQETINNYNKQQMSLKTASKQLKDKSDALKEKISQADLELNKVAQENSKLLSKVVQSPEKLQKALEEKKLTRTDIKKSENLAMQCVQEKRATIEVYKKVHEMLSKRLTQMQALHDQGNSAKAAERDLKLLKAKLSDQQLLNESTDAKIVEWRTKVSQLDEMLMMLQKERDTRYAEQSQKLEALKTEMQLKMHSLEHIEKEAEAKVDKSEKLQLEADSVWELAELKQNEMLNMLEAIMHAWQHCSSISISQNMQSIGCK